MSHFVYYNLLFHPSLMHYKLSIKNDNMIKVDLPIVIVGSVSSESYHRDQHVLLPQVQFGGGMVIAMGLAGRSSSSSI